MSETYDKKTGTEIQSESESDSKEDEEIYLKKEYRTLCESWLKLSNENLQLIKDKAMLKAQVNILELDQTTIGKTNDGLGKIVVPSPADEGINIQEKLHTEQEKNKELEEKINRMWEVFSKEQEQNKSLELKLNDNYKKIRILNQGSENLDKLMAIG